MADTENKKVIIDELVEGYDPCDLFGITADTTDDEIITIADDVMVFAANNGFTIIQSGAFAKDVLDEVQDYCLALRNQLQAMTAENATSAKLEAQFAAERAADKHNEEQ